MSAEVYVAGALRSTNREWWGIYERIGRLTEEFGLSVHVPHVDTVNEVHTSVDNLHSERDILDDPTRGEVFRIDREVVENARLIIAEVTHPSLGTGMEIGWAIQLGTPVICLAKSDAKLSNMIIGAAQHGFLALLRYGDEEDALGQLSTLLREKFVLPKV